MDYEYGAADVIIKVIPKVMRVLAFEIRQEPGGVAPAHFRLLFMLAQRPWSLTALAESQSVSLATMSKSISVLVERGWVVRREDPTDGRKLALEIAPEGRALLLAVHNKAKKRLQELLAPLSAQQRDDLRRGLELLDIVFEDESGVPHISRSEE